jgi:hypothetical protein
LHPILRVGAGSVLSENATLFLSAFPYVCPEPVLVK